MKARKKIDSPYRPDRYARRMYGKRKQAQLSEAALFSMSAERPGKKEKQRRNRRFRRTTGQMDIKSGTQYKRMDE